MFRQKPTASIYCAVSGLILDSELLLNLTRYDNGTCYLRKV